MNLGRVRSNSRAISRAVTRWGRQNYASFPWRTEQNPWLSLAAEILLQRTRASTVARVFPEFRARFPAPRRLARATEDDLAGVIGQLGLRWRIPLLKELAEELSDRDGNVPETEAELTALPAVGDYVAAAYMSLHRGRRAVIVDANVVRWLARMTGQPSDGETRRKRWLRDLADVLTPKRVYRDYNYAVLDLTMSICVRDPTCPDCPVRKYCCYRRK